MFATSGVVNTSDAREKTNIRTIDRGLAEVMQLKPVRFQWKDRPAEGDKLGLIAQDLQQVLPETVVDSTWKENDDGTREQVPAERLGVYYSDLIPVLIKAIQEQQAEIDALRQELQTLKRELSMRTLTTTHRDRSLYCFILALAALAVLVLI